MILRHLDYPHSPERLDCVDELLAYHTQRLPQAASSPSLVASTQHMVRLLLGCLTRGASGGTQGAYIREVGEYAQVVQELERTRSRIAALDAELSAEAEEEGRQRLQGKRRRLTTSTQRLVKRESELRRTVSASLPPAAASAPPSTAEPSAASPAALILASPSPSTALVVQVLQALSALSASAADQVTFDAAAAAPSPPPSPSGEEAVGFPHIPVSPPLLFPFPPASYYLSKHLLSQTQLPLYPDCVLERELFVKGQGKALQYNTLA